MYLFGALAQVTHVRPGVSASDDRCTSDYVATSGCRIFFPYVCRYVRAYLLWSPEPQFLFCFRNSPCFVFLISELPLPGPCRETPNAQIRTGNWKQKQKDARMYRMYLFGALAQVTHVRPGVSASDDRCTPDVGVSDFFSCRPLKSDVCRYVRAYLLWLESGAPFFYFFKKTGAFGLPMQRRAQKRDNQIPDARNRSDSIYI
jgi:hypothetical protein